MRKRQHRIRSIRRSACAAFLLAIGGMGIWLAKGALYNAAGLYGGPDGLKKPEMQEFVSEPVTEIQADLTQLYSPYAVLMDLDSGTVIAEQKGRERIYPASLTKIMTALVAIENLPDQEETITLPTELFSMLLIRHASLAGFEPEEQVCIKDLFYGILLPSGAECCIACADRIAGSEDAYAALMNEKAEQLGLTGTHFCNSTGLHEKKHYSTAEDMAKLLRYAL